MPVPARDVRAALEAALRAAGYRVVGKQLSVVEARRGSQVASVAMQSKLPLRAEVRLDATDTGCDVHVDLRDDWKAPGAKLMGMGAAFAKALRETQSAVDDALAGLSPGVELNEPVLESSAPDLGPLDSANLAVVGAGDVIAGKVDRVLGGGPKEATPQAWKGVAGVFFNGPEGTAALEMMDVQGMLVVGTMVSTRPANMPANLAADVQRLTVRLEQALTGHETQTIAFEVSAAERPVVEFLRQQARIRAKLPLRTMMVCTTCRFEKVVNPDYQRLAKRNSRLRTILGAVGGSVGTGGGLRMFVTVGKVMGAASLDPEFVCPRCQGIEADEFVVTYCPRCGERHAGSVLRDCPKCKHDYRAEAPPERLWHSSDSLVIPAALVKAAAPAVAPARGSTAPSVAPDWYPDPLGQHQHRYWDGDQWTEHVADAGEKSLDPIAST
ncbi:MAG: hypothetical protein QOE92_2486 [Chloroflexota bacterium]|jgi:hypothetical protein|nr:hypothetical protein [Chloroflexota bacterium]